MEDITLNFGTALPYKKTPQTSAAGLTSAATINFSGHPAEELQHSCKQTAPMQCEVWAPIEAASNEKQGEEEI